MFDDAPGAAPHGSSSGIHRGAFVLLGGGMGVPVFEGSEYRNNKSLRAAHTYSCAPSKSIDTPKQANIHTRVVYITARSLGQVDANSFLVVTRRRHRYACLVLFVLLLLFPLFVVLTVTDSRPRSGSPRLSRRWLQPIWQMQLATSALSTCWQRSMPPEARPMPN